MLIMSACTKDRDFGNELITPTDTSGQIGKSSVLINEFSASGSTLPNPDFPASSGSDWIELYNPGSDTLFMKANLWIFSDSILPGQSDIGILKKDTIVLPKSYLLIQCDGNDTVLTQIHVPFNLSKSGEGIGIFYLKNGTDTIIVDSHTFGAQTSGKTEGRIPDGSSNWVMPLNPTPGAKNQ